MQAGAGNAAGGDPDYLSQMPRWQQAQYKVSVDMC